MSIPSAFGVQYGATTEIRLPYAGLTELEPVCKDTTISAHEQTKERKTYFRGVWRVILYKMVSYSSALGNTLKPKIPTK